MNFIPAKLEKKGKGFDVEFLGVKAHFKPNEAFDAADREVILGIRPEFFTITDSGKIHALAYSTLPAGMETTVKVMLNGELISSVVFGAIDYKVDQSINCDIIGDQVCVFDKESTNLIGQGSLEVQ